MPDVLFASLVIIAVVYVVGYVFGAIGYSLSDEALKSLNVWRLLFHGAAWPWFLMRRLKSDADKLSDPTHILPKPYRKLVKKLKPQAVKQLPRSGQESGLYD